MRTDSKKIKFIAVIACVVLVIAASVSATVAYIVDQQTVSLTYNLAKFDMFPDSDGNFVYTGNVPVYFRFTVSSSLSTDRFAVDYDNAWTYIDGSYYYNSIVQPESGVIVIPSITVYDINDAGTQMNIIGEICQIEPGDAVQESWNVSYNNGVWTALSSSTNP